MKIKIIKAVVANKAVHRKDAVVDLPEAVAKDLIAKKFAIEQIERQQQQQQPPPTSTDKASEVSPDHAAYLEKLKTASKKELLEAKKYAAGVLESNPERQDAAEILAAVTELLKGK